MCKSKGGGDWWVYPMITENEVTLDMSTIGMILPSVSMNLWHDFTIFQGSNIPHLCSIYHFSN